MFDLSLSQLKIHNSKIITHISKVYLIYNPKLKTSCLKKIPDLCFSFYNSTLSHMGGAHSLHRLGPTQKKKKLLHSYEARKIHPVSGVYFLTLTVDGTHSAVCRRKNIYLKQRILSPRKDWGKFKKEKKLSKNWARIWQELDLGPTHLQLITNMPLSKCLMTESLIMILETHAREFRMPKLPILHRLKRIKLQLCSAKTCTK